MEPVENIDSLEQIGFTLSQLASQAMNPKRILYLDTYTDPTFKSISSAEIGYGITCSRAIKSGLKRLNYPIVECSPELLDRRPKLEWLYSCYQNLNLLAPGPLDVIFIFNSLIHFPGEVRRLVNHHTRHGCPIIGYTHGSHLDGTDSIRHSSNPRLLYQDIANLLSYDRLFLVTDYYRNLLGKALSEMIPAFGVRFNEIARSVGLPIDTEKIDTFSNLARRADRGRRASVLFNHAIRPPKRPEVALAVIDHILTERQNCEVHITRPFERESPLELKFDQLAQRFPGRIHCHDTLSIDSYYQLLWQCDIQFSTASHESFGVATVEAMYTGNACFTPHHLSYPEVTNGIGTYKDTNELTQLLDKAISNEDFRREISTEQKRIAQRFSGQTIARKIADVISQLP